MSERHVMVVDDEADVREFLKLAAEDVGLKVTLAEDHAQFIEHYRQCEPDVLITDLNMPGVDGIELLRSLAQLGCRARIILLSGMDAKVIDAAKRFALSVGLDVAGVLEKPVKLQRLQSLLTQDRGGLRAGRAAAQSLTPEALEASIDNEELEVHYQPKGALTGPGAGRAVGMEALVRWRHLRLGLIPPIEFIPMAERTGQIVALTRFVIRTALADLLVLQRNGVEEPFHVALNLSAQVLADLEFPDQLERQVGRAGLEPRHVLVEITESGAMQDMPTMLDVLTRLRLKGFALSIDDFGTGYSSLVQLYRIPFSEMKIDKSFVMDMSDNNEARAIVRLSSNLAKELSLSICAEGIENQDTFDALGKLGCDKGQGYLMSKPLPLAELRTWLCEKPYSRIAAAGGW